MDIRENFETVEVNDILSRNKAKGKKGLRCAYPDYLVFLCTVCQCYMCVCVCALHVCAGACMCITQRLIFFYYHSPPYLSRQGLSLILQFLHSARVAS